MSTSTSLPFLKFLIWYNFKLTEKLQKSYISYLYAFYPDSLITYICPIGFIISLSQSPIRFAITQYVYS